MNSEVEGGYIFTEYLHMEIKSEKETRSHKLADEL